MSTPLNCEKIISQLGKNIFSVGWILFPSWISLFYCYCMNIRYKYAFYKKAPQGLPSTYL